MAVGLELSVTFRPIVFVVIDSILRLDCDPALSFTINAIVSEPTQPPRLIWASGSGVPEDVTVGLFWKREMVNRWYCSRVRGVRLEMGMFAGF